MSTLLEDAINQVKVLPEAEQERIASIILQEVSKGASERLKFSAKVVGYFAFAGVRGK